MMLVAMAAASELPWECPVVETPADARPYWSDGGLGDVWDALDAEVDAWWDESGCSWVTGTWELRSGAVRTGETCTTAAGATLFRYEDE